MLAVNILKAATIKIVKYQKILKTIFFAKIVPKYKTPYLRRFGGINANGSAINIDILKSGLLLIC